MSQLKKAFGQLPRTFWAANTMELFERWAWYGMFMILALYLTGSRDTGALGFSQSQKGMLMGTVVAILYFLPVITGALADRIGYKKILVVAYLILASGYILMGQVTSFTALFFVFLYVAVGAALFKPVISASISKTTNEGNSSIGFGIFYMMVNIGAFIGPVFAGKLREISWNYVFIMSAVIISLNFIVLLLFFKEPQREVSDEPLGTSIKTALRNIVLTLKDWRFFLFLLIVTGFWSMYNQLFYSLPVFIDQWVDTSVLYDWIAAGWPGLAALIPGASEGVVNPEMITNVDAFYIIIFQILVSSFVMRFKHLNAMIGGFLVSSLGIGLVFAFNNVFFLFPAILVFGLGEMASSPKITEYIGKIAPADKVALYMGCSFLPMAGGNFFAGILSGSVYGAIADKTFLLQKALREKGVGVPQLSETFTQNDLYRFAGEKLNLSQAELTSWLWHQCHPGRIWMVFTGIGIFTVIALFLYDRWVLGKRS
ncbi:MAG: MFS transporter [Bacteroidetes bacterium]|nr:MAG: MFS transporter [Bacteroidota bacterium]PIE87910.1 MAG: MFS transporter [Bacteroidota bacterium]